jgi:hypothetical protein
LQNIIQKQNSALDSSYLSNSNMVEDSYSVEEQPPRNANIQGGLDVYSFAHGIQPSSLQNQDFVQELD